jgi:hypothetical protein
MIRIYILRKTNKEIVPGSLSKIERKGIYCMESLPIILLIVGFIAAVTLGSVAWYNSKRPPGWEDKDKPDAVPDLTPGQKKWPN